MAIHPATVQDDELKAECDVRFQRRSGPGGQHRNKVETAVVLKHRPTGVEASATERRSQSENLREALRRLRLNLALEIRQPWDAPTELWLRRCVGGRISISPSHQDFPSLLAEAIDALESHQWNPSATGESLGCSSSQLIRLLRLESRALQQLNQRREESGLRRLK